MQADYQEYDDDEEFLMIRKILKIAYLYGIATLQMLRRGAGAGYFKHRHPSSTLYLASQL